MKRALLSFIWLLLGCGTLHGAVETLTTNPLDITGTGDVIGSGSWAEASGGFRIESTVTQDADLYTYSYWITNSAEWYLAEDLDSFLIEVGDPTAIVGDIVKDFAITTNATGMDLNLNTFDLSGYGSLGSLYGLEFDLTEPGLQHLYLEFQSYMAPMMGDFFAAGTGGAFAYDAGLIGGNGQIYVPDALVSLPVPEPGTYLMLATMLFVVMIARKKHVKVDSHPS